MKKRILALIIILIIIVGAILLIERGKPQVQDLSQDSLITSSNDFSTAPELVGIEGYLNTEPITIEQFRGKVVLIDFWTYTCINCIRTLPFLTSWDEKYRDDGLVIIGVHTPEFLFEKKRENVQEAINKHNINYAVVQDNDYQTWRAFNNRYWPAKYLIDKDGLIRYTHFGEGKYEETELKIQELLAEIGKKTQEEVTKEETKEQRLVTPELYAGYKFALPRGQDIGNQQGLQRERAVQYELPEQIIGNKIYLQGWWESSEDELIAKQIDAAIIMAYVAGEVNIVASVPQETRLEVFFDQKFITEDNAGSDVEFDGDRAFIRINEPRLYNIVDGEYGDHILFLVSKQEDFSFNAFTFG